jgi:hypothetical protein
LSGSIGILALSNLGLDHKSAIQLFVGSGWNECYLHREPIQALNFLASPAMPHPWYQVIPTPLSVPSSALVEQNGHAAAAACDTIWLYSGYPLIFLQQPLPLTLCHVGATAHSGPSRIRLGLFDLMVSGTNIYHGIDRNRRHFLFVGITFRGDGGWCRIVNPYFFIAASWDGEYTVIDCGSDKYLIVCGQASK